MATKKSSPDNPSFFKGKRKCLAIGTVTLLKNKSGDRRIKITCTLNLTEDGAHKPDFVAAMFDSIAKNESANTLVKNSTELEGTAIAFFSTPKNVRAAVKAESCTLRAFTATTKKTRGKDEADIVLSFSIYAPASVALWDWGYELQGNETFAEFEPSQMTFADAASDEGETTEAPTDE